MKNLTLLNNEWKQRVDVELNEEEKALLQNFNEDKLSERRNLFKRITAESLISADTEDAIAAGDLYNKHKIEGGELISADILLPNKIGIINYRLNNKHQQIRF